MRSRVWKSVLLDTMVGPIVLAQFAVGILGGVIGAASGPLTWLVSITLNWVSVHSSMHNFPGFYPPPPSLSVTLVLLLQPALWTAFLYLLAVWVYERPTERARAAGA